MVARRHCFRNGSLKKGTCWFFEYFSGGKCWNEHLSLGILAHLLRMVMEPKYYAFWRWLYTPIILWQGEPGSLHYVTILQRFSVGIPSIPQNSLLQRCLEINPNIVPIVYLREVGIPTWKVGGKLLAYEIWNVPSWELAYPTYGRGKSSSQLPLKGIC